jgi:predicted DNA-binding transcriptional regulator AlpA
MSDQNTGRFSLGAGDRILSRAEVRALTGLSYTTIWREVRDKRFPRPISLSPNRKGFLASEIDDWLRKRADASRPR